MVSPACCAVRRRARRSRIRRLRELATVRWSLLPLTGLTGCKSWQLTAQLVPVTEKRSNCQLQLVKKGHQLTPVIVSN